MKTFIKSIRSARVRLLVQVAFTSLFAIAIVIVMVPVHAGSPDAQKAGETRTVVAPSSNDLSTQTQQNVQTKTAGGLQVVTFTRPAGRITVNLPDDIAAGDTISGTVVAEPKGNTDEERARNQGELSGYVVEIKVPKQSGPPQVITAGVPKNFFDEAVLLAYLGRQPKSQLEVGLKRVNPPNDFAPPQGQIIIAVNDFAPPQGKIIIATNDFAPPQGRIIIATNDAANANKITLPDMGQQGRPVMIPGQFDGNLGNTKVTLADRDVHILAESPRKAVFQSPSNTTGPAELVVREGTTEMKGQFRNVGVNLSAPKTSLLKGEKTELKVEVSGLQGIQQPVPLTLEASGVIRMEGGTYQPLTIQPSQVSADGRYTTTRGITGVQAGVWNATATVETHRFNVCLQDDSNPRALVLFNSLTGEYTFSGSTSSGNRNFDSSKARAPVEQSSANARGEGWIEIIESPYSFAPPGTGKVTIGGAAIHLEGNDNTRRVVVDVDRLRNSGAAVIEVRPTKQKFTIRDRDTRNDICPVQ